MTARLTRRQLLQRAVLGGLGGRWRPDRRIGLKNSRFRAALDDAYLRSIRSGVHA